MAKAYNEVYLNDVMINLGDMFDYLINCCDIDCDFCSVLFIDSGLAKLFEMGNPSVISGRSGVENARIILSKIYDYIDMKEEEFYLNKSAEYWAGWALAQFQWYTSIRFKDIFSKVSLSEIIMMYYPYHEMDIRHFIDELNRRINEKIIETNLSRLRKSNNLSQSELASISGVSLRSIQLYEQRVNDINKAQSITLYKLACVLKCNIEDLLECPV